MTPEQQEQQLEAGKGLLSIGASAIPLERAVTGVAWLGRNAYAAYVFRFVVNPKTGLTGFQTKAIASFFGKGVDGAKAVIAAARKSDFALPRGVTAQTLTKYREVAMKAIEAGKPAQVQEARIKAIDAALAELKRIRD